MELRFTQLMAVCICAAVLKTSAQEGHWQLQASYEGVEMNEIAFVDTATGYVFADGPEGPMVLKTTDGGESWSDVSPISPDSRFMSASFLDTSNGYAAGRFDNNGVIAHTTDGGATWSINSSLGERLNGIAFSDANTGIACGRDGYAVRTTDGGLNWNPFSVTSEEDLTAVTFFAPGKGILVGDEGFITMTNDNGATWNDVTSPSDASFTAVYFLNESTGWIAGDPGELLQTTDGGNTWTSISTGANAPLLDVTAVDASKVWSGGENGTLVTTDDGETWIADTALTNEPITGLAARGNYAWLISEDGFIFRWNNKVVSDTTGDTTATSISTYDVQPKFYFEGKALVVSSLPSNAVSVSVYNALGQLERHTSNLSSGTVRVDMPTLNAAVYFVVLRDRLGETLLVRKVISN